MLRSLYLTLQFLILFTSIHAQKSVKLWENDSALQCASSIMNALYKCDFEKSDSLMQTYNLLMGEHSSTSLLKAMTTYWKHSPFDYENEGSIDLLFKDLDKCIELSTESYEKNNDYNESIFFLLLARSIKARTYNYKGATWKAVSEAKQVYSLTREGMENLNNFNEFNFSSGIYNYFREYFSEAHPIYRPFLNFFPPGNKSLGIQQLELARTQSIFTSAEAQRYLMWIYTRNKDTSAVTLAYDFLDHYSDNNLFTFESLLTINYYGGFENEKVLDYISNLEKSETKVFKVGSVLMKGIYYFENGDYLQSIFYLKETENRLKELSTRSIYIESPLYAYLYAINIIMHNDELSKVYEKKAENSNYGSEIIDHLNSKLLSRL